MQSGTPGSQENLLIVNPAKWKSNCTISTYNDTEYVTIPKVGMGASLKIFGSNQNCDLESQTSSTLRLLPKTLDVSASPTLLWEKYFPLTYLSRTWNKTFSHIVFFSLCLAWFAMQIMSLVFKHLWFSAAEQYSPSQLYTMAFHILLLSKDLHSSTPIPHTVCS